MENIMNIEQRINKIINEQVLRLITEEENVIDYSSYSTFIQGLVKNARERGKDETFIKELVKDQLETDLEISKIDDNEKQKLQLMRSTVIRGKHVTDILTWEGGDYGFYLEGNCVIYIGNWGEGYLITYEELDDNFIVEQGAENNYNFKRAKEAYDQDNNQFIFQTKKEAKAFLDLFTMFIKKPKKIQLQYIFTPEFKPKQLSTVTKEDFNVFKNRRVRFKDYIGENVEFYIDSVSASIEHDNYDNSTTYYISLSFLKDSDTVIEMLYSNTFLSYHVSINNLGQFTYRSLKFDKTINGGGGTKTVYPIDIKGNPDILKIVNEIKSMISPK